MVKLSAAELLQNYREKGYLGADMSAWIVPRIIQSIEELPALAQRQDNAEMRAKLKVIKGYLDLIVDSKEAQSSLAAASEILMVALRRKSFVLILFFCLLWRFSHSWMLVLSHWGSRVRY